MTTLRSDFLKSAKARGYVHQCTDEASLDQKLCTGVVPAYIGFDCTAPSLHVGSLVSIMLLRLLQKSGHKPIVLMGGGTTKVGDPSGKDESRKLLTDADIAANMAGIKTVFSRFLKFGDGPTDAVMVNNADWLDKLSYIAFLRDYGRHFTINRMMTFDSVKLRLEREQPLTFLEFNYMILQAYDFVELARHYKCALQMGGSDQWGNIVNGVELGRRAAHQELFGLTTPLLTTSSGAKMGKTAAGAVWLNPDMLSPYDYWQYWRNTEDADVGRFLRLFTELPEDDIVKLETAEGAGINEAKKILANEATRMAHGEDAAKTAAETARKTFEEGTLDSNLRTVELSLEKIKDGIAIYAMLVEAGLALSNTDARNKIKGNSVKVNDKPVTEELKKFGKADLVQLKDGCLKLSAGKKHHALIKIKID
jgi:tyrosyl-tRNA synthetase